MDKFDIWKVEWKDAVIEWGKGEESKKRPRFLPLSHWCGGKGRTDFRCRL